MLTRLRRPVVFAECLCWPQASPLRCRESAAFSAVVDLARNYHCGNPISRPRSTKDSGFGLKATFSGSRHFIAPRYYTMRSPTTPVAVGGDLNNIEALRKTIEILPDAAYDGRTLAISEGEDDTMIRTKYRPFLLDEDVATSDWISQLELSTALKIAETDFKSTNDRLKVLVLYGSLRSRQVGLRFLLEACPPIDHISCSSYSKLVAYEASRILHRLGCDVRVFDPSGLPVKDDVQHSHAKVQELRDLSKWSDGHVWVCPEQHGTLTAVFKNQIDWIPLSTGSVRPTQGRTLAIAQVSGGSQSFNTVNALRILGRWMRMFTIPNQSSIPMAYTQFTDAVEPAHTDRQCYVHAEGGSRMMPSGNRDRLVDCMEEFVKYTTLMRPTFDLFNDRYSERKEREEKRRLKEVEEQTRAVNGVNLAAV
nr:nadph-dependent fmn reductase arsh [Quercus suber]